MKKIVCLFSIILFVALSCSKESNKFSISRKPDLPSLSVGLSAYYPFDGNANDASGNQLDGVVNGATPATDRFGARSAYQFKDNQDIIVPSSVNQNLFPISISVWYNAKSLSYKVATNIFSKYEIACWNGYQIVLSDCDSVANNEGGGDIYYSFGPSVSSWYLRSHPSPKIIGFYGESPFLQPNIEFDHWYNYIFVVDETGGKIYVDGDLISYHKWTGMPGPCSSPQEWKIGGSFDEGNNWFNGMIDDVRIYDRALTQEEITFLSSN